MSKRLFITGSCSPTLGNWEQQLGNAAILIGLIRSIHKNLPNALVTTKYQLSEKFCQKYMIQSLQVELETGTKVRRAFIGFYNLFSSAVWRFFAEIFRIDVSFLHSTQLLDTYYKVDVIIDLSGDTYGDNIPFKNFIKHSFELIAARLLRKPVISFANSPGPLSGWIKRIVARAVFNNIPLITTREPNSTDLLHNLKIRTPVITTACPAFLLEAAPDKRVEEIMQSEDIDENSRPIIGITLAGYNLYSMPTWDIPKSMEDLELYAPTVRFLLEELHAEVLLIPHVYRTNPWTGQYIQGPDYVILKTLKHMVSRYSKNKKLKIIEGTYDPSEVKGLIGKLDLHISGRLHAGVAAFSQYVPTILLAYGHKHLGFAKMLNQKPCVWHPAMGPNGLLELVRQVWKDKEKVVAELRERVPVVKELAELNVSILKEILALDERLRNRLPQELINKWKSLGWEDRDLSGSASSGQQSDRLAGSVKPE